jgi:hypothetical protein
MAAAAAARRLSPSTGFYTDLAILPIGRTLVDNPTADMRPAFGSPIPVFAKVDADSNGTFVDFYHAIAVLNEVGNKLEHFQRCYLHHSQILKAGPTLQIWAVDGAEAEVTPEMFLCCDRTTCPISLWLCIFLLMIMFWLSKNSGVSIMIRMYGLLF